MFFPFVMCFWAYCCPCAFSLQRFFLLCLHHLRTFRCSSVVFICLWIIFSLVFFAIFMMSDDFFVFPEEEEAPEVRAAKLRLHKTLKRNRTREKEVLQPLPAAEKIFLSENVSELEQQNIQPQKTKMRHSSVENEKNISHNKEVNRKDSIDGENRSKRRKLKNESIQEKTSTNTMNADRIQDPYKKQTFYKNGKKNYKNDAVVKTSYTQNINLIDQLSKHLEKASHKDAQKNQIRELELKRNTNFNGNAKESINIIEEYKDEMGKTDGMVKNKTQQEIQIKQRTKGTGVHNQQNNKGFICTVPKNQLKDESLVDVVNIEEENKQQDNGGEDVITLDDVQDQISEEKNERIKDSDSAQNRNKRKERSIRNTSTRTEMEKMGERKNKKHTTTHRSQSLKRKTSDTTVNMKRSFRMSDHISTDKENDWETGTNSHNRTGKGNKKQVHQNNGKERDQTKGLQNDNKRRNLSIPIITINSNGSNSPITISSMTCSTSESSEVNYLNETQKNKENWKHKNQSIGDKNKKSENEDDIYQTTTYDKKRGTVPMSMAQLDNMVEESKTRKKGNVEVDARELMKNLKKHYNSLNKTEKLYYCYMMKKLKIKYDNKKNVFYNDGMFINNFSKKMKQDKTQWDHVSYMEYSIYYMLKWLTPTEEEKLIKLKALMKLEIIVKSIFTKAKMEVFGSFVTGLSIPGADVDVCFMNIEEDELNALYIIAYTLVKLNICHSFNILVHAQVKILRYIDKELGVRFDVCINQKSSRKTTDFIAKQVKKYVYLRPLVLLVKFFLSTRQLNETYSGGIGSFLISCMVLHFLQMHESAHNEKALHASTLTSLLLEFFNFYSFDYKLKEKCVVLRGMGHILPMYFRKELQDADRRLCFENPIDIDLNVGQKSFRIKFILYAFSYGLCTLISLLERLYSSNNKYSIANNPDTKNCHGGPTQIYGSRMYSPEEEKEKEKEKEYDGTTDDEISEDQDVVMQDHTVQGRNRDFTNNRKEESKNGRNKERRKISGEGGVKKEGYIESSYLNSSILYPLFYGHFLNPNHIIFTKRIKKDSANFIWNGEQCAYKYSDEIKENMFRMLCSYFKHILEEGDKLENINDSLFTDFTKIFAFTLDVKNNIFKNCQQ